MTSSVDEGNGLEYEIGLLGLILVDSKIFHNVKELVKASDFYVQKHQLIYQAINNVYEKGFDEIEMLPILTELKEQGWMKTIGGEQYLAELMRRPALPSNVINYTKQIVDFSDLRQVKTKINKLNKDIAKTQKHSAADILEKIELDILDTTRGNKIKEFIDSKVAINRAIKSIEDRASGKSISGISIGFPSLDKITGGFQKGDLIILAARPSMGKTAFALNMAANAAFNHHVAFFSLEMPLEQLFNRIIGFTAYIDQNKIRESQYLSKNDWNKIRASKSKIEKMKLFVDDTAGIKLSELVWKAKRLHKNGKLDIIFIDYLQLILGAGARDGNRQNEVSIISQTLKKLARDLNIPVVALSQLSRRVEQRESKIPMMSDLRESGAIEQDADIVSFIYRDAYYNREENEQDGEKEISDIIIAKHRNGSTGSIKLFFKPDNGLFIERGD